MTDWNPNDPDATRVIYDLSRWTFDQQAELASEMADAAIPHTWEGTDLMVPEEAEAQTDSAIAAVELRLFIVDADDDEVIEPTTDEDMEPPEPVELAADVPSTEFQLDEWSAVERDKLTRGLVAIGRAFRWENTTLVVASADEEQVEAVLDLVEQGLDTGAVNASGDEAEQLPFETLTTFFLAGERLRKDPMDAEGLRQLVNATEVADPEHPPYGVDSRLWTRTCELADEVADALAGDDDPDVDTAQQAAEDLHDLLRPYI